MEYRELHDKESEKLKQVAATRDSLTTHIQEGRRILANHLALAERRGDDIALAEAYEDDAFTDDGDVDLLHIAADIRGESKAGRILAMIQAKLDSLASQAESRFQLNADIERSRGLLKRIARFNPNVIQSKSHRYLSKFDTRIKPDDWLDENRRRREEQNKQTNSLLKVVMDMFVHPDYRGLPRNRDADFDDPGLILNVPFDPARISDSLLEGLEFDLPQEGAHEIERLEHKFRLIPALKAILIRCIPMTLTVDGGGKRNYRLLVIGNGDRKRDRNGGKIIIPRYDTSAPLEERQKVPAVFKSAYDALRQTEHVSRQYEDELKFVSEAKLEVAALHKRLLELRPGDENYEVQKIEITKRLHEVVERLMHSVTLYKHTAYESLKSAADLKDSRGRENLGASRARMVKILDRLEKRLKEASKTSLAFPENAVALRNTINYSEDVLRRYGEAFDEYSQYRESHKFSELQGTLQKLNVRPFNLYAQSLMDCMLKMNSAKKGDTEGRRLIAIKALAITRLSAVQSIIEDVLFGMNGMTNINAARQLIKEKTVSVKNCSVPEYRNVFEKVETYMQQAVTEEYETPEKAKAYLKELDFEELLEHIR